jgi:hypothetical protein
VEELQSSSIALGSVGFVLRGGLARFEILGRQRRILQLVLGKGV